MIRVLLATVFLWAGVACADTYTFILNRFGGIEVSTNGETGKVRFFQENKNGETFTSMVVLKNGVTPDGAKFEILKLDKPVVHDWNRHINSGSYMLRITRATPALQMRLPPLADFAKSKEPMTFYGEKTGEP
jgi:hypothetical protein